MTSRARRWWFVSDPWSAEWARDGQLRDDDLIFAVNREAQSSCETSLGRPCVLVDEIVLRDEFREMNTWAFDQIFYLIGRHRPGSAAGDFLEEHFLDVRSLLVRSVKFFRMTERLVADHGAPEGIVFSGGGLGLFESAVRESFLQSGRSIDIRHPDSHPAVASSASRTFGLGKGLSVWLRKKFAQDADRTVRRALKQKLGGPRILASGSLAHLEPVLLRLRRSGVGVCLAEPEYSRKVQNFCRKNGILYFLPRRTEEVRPPLGVDPLYRPNDERAVYRSFDLTDHLNAAVRDGNRLGVWLNRPFDPEDVRMLFGEFNPDAVLLGDDISLRRVFLTRAQKMNRPCAVFSHGIPVILTADPERKPTTHYRSGVLFVNSEFEKESYRGIYYDPAKIEVSGRPQYDRHLSFLAGVRRERSVSERKTLLCFPPAFLRYDFTRFSVLSNVLGQRGLCADHAESYVRDLAKIAADHPGIDLVVKPHYAEEKEWRRILGGQARCRVLDHRADVFDAIRKADGVVTTPSTIITESMILRKPVILLNYLLAADQVRAYVSRGVAMEVRNVAELENAVRDLVENAPRVQRMREAVDLHRTYFCGSLDGGASDRAAGWLLKNAKGAAIHEAVVV